MPPLDDPGPCPPGFKPLFRTSPFLDASGPFFYKPEESGFIVGLRVLDKHTNASGTVHGGLVATLADVSMGYVAAASKTPALRMITASLGIDFVGTAQVGEWVESHVDVVKAGSRLAFANARIAVDGACVASARAVFLVP
ncbi:PaaI family thioesterase [Ottowia sp.]|uniref:PaaI family thioesterase n=1 Tax=Ottowia sp. TaxID=1898956 RepID=UPI0025DF0A92|nr:PaaI family thioesterase [Ottowia sp.]MBK6613236.1 PaaI family thioesterase [Ottowia sp.]MBK6747656.1 PaaI family thioesterase [Ottowia sp.]